LQFGLSVRSTNQKHNRLEASRAAGANMVMHWLKSNWQNRLFGVADVNYPTFENGGFKSARQG